MIIQFCGLSGSGKTTLANKAKEILSTFQIPVEIIDGDEYRKTICKDLGFSKEDRAENIRRLAAVANEFSAKGKVAIICAINPYDVIRKWVTDTYKNIETVFIKCSLETLISRDPKGLYKRALLSDNAADKINNLTGINDPFEPPLNPDLIIDTSLADVETCANKLVFFIKELYNK